MSRLDLHIKKPCSENWNSFEKNGNVGFCSSCQKNVIDFTKYSDKQIADFFKNNTGETCGRFLKDQLKTYQLQKERSQFTRIAAVLTVGVLSLAIAPNATAQSDNRVISGNVVASDNNAFIPGVNIVVKNTSIGAVTDTEGNFKLPYNGDQKEITLVFSFIGMVSEERKINLLDGSLNTGTVKLQLDNTMIGEIVVGMVTTEEIKINEERPTLRLFKKRN